MHAEQLQSNWCSCDIIAESKPRKTTSEQPAELLSISLCLDKSAYTRRCTAALLLVITQCSHPPLTPPLPHYWWQRPVHFIAPPLCLDPFMDVRCCKCGSSNGGERQKEERREEREGAGRARCTRVSSLSGLGCSPLSPAKWKRSQVKQLCPLADYYDFASMTTTLAAHTNHISGSRQLCLLTFNAYLHFYFILFFSKHAKVRCSQPGGLNRCKSHLSKCRLSQSKGDGQAVWVAALRDLRAESLLGLYLDLSI